MDDFSPAAISITNDRTPRQRQALLHHPALTIEDVNALLETLAAADWPVFTIAGESGVYILPKGGVPVSDFARILLGLGDDWILCADPRHG
jgi:hypothetical protein